MGIGFKSELPQAMELGEASHLCLPQFFCGIILLSISRNHYGD